MRRLLVIALCLLFALPVNADFWVAPQDRMPNTRGNEGGVCAFAAAETLAGHLGISKLRGLRDHARMQGWQGGVDVFELAHAIVTQGVSVTVNVAGTRNAAFCEEACKQKRGCVIGVVGWPCDHSFHAVVLAELTNDTCVFYENNQMHLDGTKPVPDDLPPQRWRAARRWFDAHWTGFALTIDD